MDVVVVGGVFREILDGDTAPRLRYGGSGLTSSIAAARFGARVALASYVGSEDVETVRAELELAGVDDRALIELPGACGTFVFPTHEDPRQPWPMYRPAEQLPSQMPQIPKAGTIVAFGIPDCDPVAMGWLGSGDVDATMIWDRQGWLSRAQDARAVVRLQACRRIYLANEREATEEVSANSLAEALAKQPPDGFDVAVVKRGDAGVTVIERDARGASQTPVLSFPVRAQSTVGSGDVFAGVLAARLAQGVPVASAARWACAAAAVALHTGRNLLTSDACEQARELMLA